MEMMSDPKMLDIFDEAFKNHHEHMAARDLSEFYHVFTKQLITGSNFALLPCII